MTTIEPDVLARWGAEVSMRVIRLRMSAVKLFCQASGVASVLNDAAGCVS